MKLAAWPIAAVAICMCGLPLVLAPAGETADVAASARDTPDKQKTQPRQTRFSVQHGDSGWSFVSPTGQRFFSLGVCVLTQGTARDAYDPARPSYAAWRHYDTPTLWADAALRRLKSWGFTTIGGWSDVATLNQSSEQTLWLMPVPHLGSTVGFPWWDMWNEKHLARMERLAAERLGPLRDDPRVIGYYSDNEIGWWNAALWKMTLEQPAVSGQRQRLIQLLHEVYDDDWSALTADFSSHGAENWQQLERGGSLAHRPGANGIRTMRRFLALVAERYYKLMHDVIRRHDPDALYLGDRYQSFYYPEVARASRPYVDVASTNLNASWNDGSFLRCYVDTLHKLTGKPVQVSEFYMAAMENRSGNKNASSGFPTVATQAERVAAARNTLRFVASLPEVVGIEWFQYCDEPPLGRAQDGEDYNFGLVDVEDRPYDELTAMFAAFDPQESLPARSRRRPDATSGIPRAPADPFSNMKFMEALKHWDRERGFVPSASEAPLGDLYVCWKPEALYVGLYALDVVEAAYYPDGVLPEADRAAWSVELQDAGAVTARLGGGEAPIVSDPAIRVECLSGFDHNVRLIALMEIPAQRLGKQRFAPGDTINLRSTLTTHGRAYQFTWNAKLPLAD
jgi:hypothetical protein